jgi:cell division GTPase FtsZ
MRLRGSRVHGLLLSVGGGGGNILTGLRTMLKNDVDVMRQISPEYAEYIERNLDYCYVDTNQFSIPHGTKPEHCLLLGDRHFGSGQDPAVALRAYRYSRRQFKDRISKAAWVALVGTGGKGTATGTFSAMVKDILDSGKLLMAWFVEPSVDNNEVCPDQHRRAMGVVDQLDELQVRFALLRNKALYGHGDNRKKAHAKMNASVASGIRGVVQVLQDPNQFDCSDMERLMGVTLGQKNRFFVGCANIEGAEDDGSEASIRNLAQACVAHQTYYDFPGRLGPTLVSINGRDIDVESRISSELFRLAMREPEGSSQQSTPSNFDPRFVFAPDGPKAWGVTCVFTNGDGNQKPLKVKWPDTIERPVSEPVALVSVDLPAPSETTLPAITSTPKGDTAESNGDDTEPKQDEVKVSASTPPRPRRRRTNAAASPPAPPRGGKTPAHTPLRGASTDPSSKPVTGQPVVAVSHENPDPGYESFSAFVKDFNRKTSKVERLLSTQDGHHKIPVEPGEIRRVLSGPVLRGDFARYPSALRDRIRSAACSKSPGLIAHQVIKLDSRPWSSIKKCALNQMTRELWKIAKVNIADKTLASEAGFVRAAVELFGNEVLKDLPFADSAKNASEKISLNSLVGQAKTRFASLLGRGEVNVQPETFS